MRLCSPTPLTHSTTNPNRANDVANAYSTSVAAQTLTMAQAGMLAAVTEFTGAVALGKRVTDTIKNNIIDIDHFRDPQRPGVLMLVMGCAEVGSATWLLTATTIGFPVSTTQTIVGALVGVGLAARAPIAWSWASGGVAQVAASWAIAPCLAAIFAAILFSTLKFGVLERKDSFKWALRVIPWYIGFTAGVLALFLAVEVPNAPDITEVEGTIIGAVLGVFFGVTAIGYIFFVPFFRAKLVKKNPKVRIWHLPMGPLLNKENPPLYWPGNRDQYCKDYYARADGTVVAGTKDAEKGINYANDQSSSTHSSEDNAKVDDKVLSEKALDDAGHTPALEAHRQKFRGPTQRFIDPVRDLPIYNPRKIWGYIKWFLLQGVTRDVISQDSARLRQVHAHAHRYDVRVEHMWTYCQVLSAIMMSIAHGSNDVANAVGPFAASYATFTSGRVDTESPTPVWFLVIAGILLGAGFWFYGFFIVRSLGNKITQMSPTRGFSIELGAAMTVLMASRLGLPVSTTQCLTGAALGVALMVCPLLFFFFFFACRSR